MRREQAVSGMRHQASEAPMLSTSPFSPSPITKRKSPQWFIDRTCLKENTFIKDNLIDWLVLHFCIQVSGNQGISDCHYP